MSKLEELLQQYCPNGVPYRNLEDCCYILDSQRKPVTKGSRVAGKYPYYGANGIQDYVADYIFDGTYVLVGEDGSVMTQNYTPVVTFKVIFDSCRLLFLHYLCNRRLSVYLTSLQNWKQNWKQN